MEKPSLLVLNKSDRKYTQYNSNLKKLEKISHAPVIPISAKEGTNLELLLSETKRVFQEIKDKEN